MSKIQVKFGSAEFLYEGNYERDFLPGGFADLLLDRFYRFISREAQEPIKQAPTAEEERAAEAATLPPVVPVPGAPFKLEASLKATVNDETRSWEAGEGVYGTLLSATDTKTALHDEPLAAIPDQMASVVVSEYMGRPVIEFKMDANEPDRLFIAHR